MSDPHPQRTAIERREAAVAELVRVVMQTGPGHRYATAYGTLSALVTSSDLDPLSYARSFVRQLEEAMQTGLTGTVSARARLDALDEHYPQS